MLWGLRRCGSRKSGGQTSVCLSKARADAPKHRSGRVERCLVRLGVNGLGFGVVLGGSDCVSPTCGPDSTPLLRPPNLVEINDVAVQNTYSSPVKEPYST